MRRASLLAVVVVAVVAPLVGCVPEKKGPVAEVATGGDRRTAPTLPASGTADVDDVVTGLMFDMSTDSSDLNLWVPSTPQARCAARRIVQALGVDRIVSLGYQPGVSGAALNELDLTEGERTTVAGAMAACIDVEAAVGSLLAGNGQMSGQVAACVAKGLASQDQLLPFVRAWAFREPVDVFSGPRGGLAASVLSAMEVCLPDTAFNWPAPRSADSTDPTSGSSTTIAP